MRTWSALIGAHLYGSRQKGWEFDRAYGAAKAAHPKPESHPDCEAVFRAGYYRQRRIGGNAATGASLLADSDQLFVDHVYVAPTFEGEPVCGWGEGCDLPPREGGWLCEWHKARVRVPSVMPMCLHPECHKDHAASDALIVKGVVDDYCKRHRKQTELEAVGV